MAGRRIQIPILIAAAILVVTAAGDGGGKSVALTLERAVDREGMRVSQLRELDRIRHGRVLGQLSSVDFPVGGSYNPYTAGLYYTRVQIGNPAKEFYVQIDTGSDVLWVNCVSCSGCPSTSGLNIPMQTYDPSSSSTSSLVSCTDSRCIAIAGGPSQDATCANQNQNQCGYLFQYGDGSKTSGYYVQDTLDFETITGNSQLSNSSASVIFGCSTSESGDLTKSDSAVDGIFGFGQASLSVVSQLSSKGITPNSFSHCLSGQQKGGGILVLGQIVEPNIVFTPLVPNQSHYNVNLETISVNGQTLDIPSSVFVTTDAQGTIIDSGTTLAYLAVQAYNPFVDAITQYATGTGSVQTTTSDGNQCYITLSSLSSVFPQVSLNFQGGVSMTLNPQDYLLQQDSVGGASVWCIGIQPIQSPGYMILGDLVLQDKIVVYDLDEKRIGWVNYDCSSPVNVSTGNNTSSSSPASVTPGEVNVSGSLGYRPREMSPFRLVVTAAAVLLSIGAVSFS